MKIHHEFFNAFQTAAKNAYGAGDYAHHTTMKEVREAGDTLYLFVMLELSDKEDCKEIVTALSRMETARADIDTVTAALQALEVEP